VSEYVHLLFALLPLGIVIGLWIGPAKERLDAAYTDGFVSGMKSARTPPHNHQLDKEG